MRTADFFDKVEPALNLAEDDGDATLICHVSEDELRFRCLYANLEPADAMIIVTELIRDLRLNPVHLIIASLSAWWPWNKQEALCDDEF